MSDESASVGSGDPESGLQVPASLVVFSDDWGRHPSSSQHLIGRLLGRYDVLWVNTIGTRTPKLDAATMRRVIEKLGQWRATQAEAPSGPRAALSPRILNPRMWPWFTRPFDRWLNRRLLATQLRSPISELPKPVTAVTTLPITADLPGSLSVDKWVYYCVDDFAEWPGLDGDTLRRMDEAMMQVADEIVVVSERLRELAAQRGRQAELLTHGVDLDRWVCDAVDDSAIRADRLGVAAAGPLIVFWGVVDRRLDAAMLTELARRAPQARIVLVGPQQDPDPEASSLPNVDLVGPRPFEALPSIARTADVLIMPYADLPVTRAMQPLKLKEYLATGRPVVASSLPAVTPWQDALDMVTTPTEFADAVLARIESGITAEQRAARERLRDESWTSKATIFETFLRVLTGRGE